MKKMIVIFLGLLSFNAYAYDATRGALQNDPTLCQYGTIQIAVLKIDLLHLQKSFIIMSMSKFPPYLAL